MMENKIMDINAALASNKTEHESFKRRLTELEKQSNEKTAILVQLQKQSDEIKSLSESIKSMVEGIEKLEKRVSELEQKPGHNARKLWYEVVKYIVLAGLGAAIAMLSKGGM